MRPVTLIFTIALFSLLSSCSEDNGGDVSLIYEYYYLTDSLGNDLTQSNTINSIKFLAYSENEFVEVILDSIQVGEKSIFGFTSFGNEGIHYIEFNGVDIDTISRVKSSRGAGLRNIDKITYYYNGEEMETLDFIENPELKSEIEERNTQYIERETTNPFYVTLVKK